MTSLALMACWVLGLDSDEGLRRKKLPRARCHTGIAPISRRWAEVSFSSLDSDSMLGGVLVSAT
jgi:hypothetical protein